MLLIRLKVQMMTPIIARNANTRVSGVNIENKETKQRVRKEQP